MTNKIAELILVILVKHNVQIDDTELWLYGCRVMIRNSIIFMCSLVISLYFDFFIEYIIFNFIFLLDRQLTGGYHANSSLVCFIQSTLVIIAVPYLLHIDNYINTSVSISISVILTICLLYIGIFKKKKLFLSLIILLVTLALIVTNIIHSKIICAALICDLFSYAILVKKKSHAFI